MESPQEEPVVHPEEDAPDANEPGDALPEDLKPFVHDETKEIVPDNVDEEG